MEAFIEHGVRETEQGHFELTFPKEWEAHNYSQPPNVMNELERVKVPCVGIRARPSVFFSQSMWDEWQQKSPDTQFYESLDHGHLFPLENPTHCSDLIQKGIDAIL